MKISKWVSVVSAALSLAFIPACDSDDKDVLEEVTLDVQVYPTNDPNAYSASIDGTTATTKSNRPVSFNFGGFTTEIKKVELTRTINGVATTCNMLTTTGEVRSVLMDWAAASTDYLFKVSTEDASKDFGPYKMTVESAERIVAGDVPMSDQNTDVSASSGSFFQSRSVAIGFGGYTGANFNSDLAKGYARLLDFAILTDGTTLKAVSPDDIQGIHEFPNLKNDCGFQTTQFETYVGALDPTDTTPPTLAEIDALTLPAPSSSINLTAGLKFVYQTSDGKKGLIKIMTLNAGASPTLRVGYASQQ